MFTTPLMNNATRAAFRSMAQKQTLNLRAYSTQAPKKSGSKLLFATLVGVGIAGGIAYNSSETKVIPAEKKTVKKELVGAFNPEGFVPLKLKNIEPVSHDTFLYRFDLPEGQSANLPVASCVLVKHTPAEGKPIVRPYTPVSDADTEGHVDFVIKTYKTGKLTPLLQELKPGDEVQFKGPIVKYNWEEKKKTHVGMIAGGTGITPMLQVIRRIFHEDAADSKNTKVTLLFGNQTENDILLKEELDKIAKEHPDRFKVVYALDKAPENWEGVSGYITKEVVEAHLPGPNEPDTVIMVCGPPPMVKSVAGPKNRMEQGELDGILKELGYVKENVFKF